MTFYLCDGKNECNIDKDCYTNGGKCRHTVSISHAKNFKTRKSECFSLFCDYWEKDEDGENDEKNGLL